MEGGTHTIDPERIARVLPFLSIEEKGSLEDILQALSVRPLETDYELQRWIELHLGIEISSRRVCEHHASPLQILADCYFARFPRSTLYGSRGFAGKSILLAVLSLTESITLGAGVTLLGGSGEQSMRVHAYMEGVDPAMPGTFWAHPNAPRWLRRTDPSKRETSLANNGYLRALMASQKSVRGPHPQRLRGDEIDEMEKSIWDAAQGQPMGTDRIPEQTMGSSTWQNPHGTMSAEMKEATEKGWPIYSICYRESIAAGWLTEEAVDRKRATIPDYMWDTEYELGRPTARGDRVYISFHPIENTAPVTDPGGDLLIGMDFNVSPMTAVVAAKVGDELHVIDEIELWNSSTDEMCQVIFQRYVDLSQYQPMIDGAQVTLAPVDTTGIVAHRRRPSGIVIYPDASGNSRRTSAVAGQTDFSILRSYGFGLRAPKANPPVVDRVNEMNALCQAATKRRRLFLHPRCARLRDHLSAVCYKEGTSIVDKTQGIEHDTDALGYLVHVEFPLIRRDVKLADSPW